MALELCQGVLIQADTGRGAVMGDSPTQCTYYWETHRHNVLIIGSEGHTVDSILVAGKLSHTALVLRGNGLLASERGV